MISILNKKIREMRTVSMCLCMHIFLIFCLITLDVYIILHRNFVQWEFWVRIIIPDPVLAFVTLFLP